MFCQAANTLQHTYSFFFSAGQLATPRKFSNSLKSDCHNQWLCFLLSMTKILSLLLKKSIPIPRASKVTGQPAHTGTLYYIARYIRSAMERTTLPKIKGENQNKSATRKLRTAAGLRKSCPLDSATHVPERPCVCNYALKSLR